jgi:2-C-methyl-D-erythritol 2,4-cyclodiphosphate synthase
VRELLGDAGYRVVNTDITIVAEAPRMAEHIPAMCSRIADDLGLAANGVSVKATTSERMGFTGRGEGIAAFAVVLLEA